MYNILILLALRITTKDWDHEFRSDVEVGENSGHFATSPLVFSAKWRLRTSAEILYWWRVTTRIWLSASDWLKQFYAPRHAPIRSTTHIWERRRHFAGKQWWRRKMPAVFLGYGCTFSICCKTLKLILVPLGARGFSFAHSLTYSSRLRT